MIVYRDLLDRTRPLTNNVLKQCQAASSHRKTNYTIVITNWLTVTKYPYLK